MPILIFARPIGKLHIEQEHQPRDRQPHLHQRHALPNASSGTDTERTECPTGSLDIVLADLPLFEAACRGGGAGLAGRALDPPLGEICPRHAVVFALSVDGKGRGAAVGSAREEDSIDQRAAFHYFAGRSARHGGGETQRLVETGFEVDEVVELCAADDVFDGGEGVAHFGLEFGHRGGVAHEVEDCCCEGRGGGVAACDHEHVGFAPELGRGEALAGFGVFRVEEVVEEVFLRVVAGLGALFGAFVRFHARLHDEVPAVVGQSVDEDLVQMPAIQGHPEAALSPPIVYQHRTFHG